MKTITTALFTFAALNLVLLLMILYWFVFTNEPPPFVQGRPMFELVFGLSIVSVVAGGTGVIHWLYS